MASALNPVTCWAVVKVFIAVVVLLYADLVNPAQPPVLKGIPVASSVGELILTFFIADSNVSLTIPFVVPSVVLKWDANVGLGT